MHKKIRFRDSMIVVFADVRREYMHRWRKRKRRKGVEKITRGRGIDNDVDEEIPSAADRRASVGVSLKFCPAIWSCVTTPLPSQVITATSSQQSVAQVPTPAEDS
jgi:hypothetical protein